MQVRIPMTRKVITVPPSLSIANAWKILRSEDIRHLPVVRDGKLVGILSDRDLLRVGHVLPSGDLGFMDRSVADIMTLTLIVCSPTASVGDTARIMTEAKIDALPVVSNERLVGLVTSTDLLLLLVDSPEQSLPFDYRLSEVSVAG